MKVNGTNSFPLLTLVKYEVYSAIVCYDDNEYC